MDQQAWRGTDPQSLRREAESRLAGGTATGGSWSISPRALNRLYRLASDPATASDALALLQELQAHQVELDLQTAQLAENAHDCGQALAQYRMVFDAAPVGYLVVATDGTLRQINQRGAAWLGASPDELTGRPLAWLLEADSRGGVQRLLEQALASDTPLRASVHERGATVAALWHTVSVVAAPGGDAVLITLDPS